jgi:hypothetical protein
MTNVIPEQYLYFSKVRTSFVLFCQSGEASFLVSHASSAAQHLYFFTSQSSESRRSKTWGHSIEGTEVSNTLCGAREGRVPVRGEGSLFTQWSRFYSWWVFWSLKWQLFPSCWGLQRKDQYWQTESFHHQVTQWAFLGIFLGYVSGQKTGAGWIVVNGHRLIWFVNPWDPRLETLGRPYSYWVPQLV